MVDLPPGYTVEFDMAVGYRYLNETGDIIFQHPYDDENARAAIWHDYQKRQSKKAKKGK